MSTQGKIITVVCTGNVCRSPMAERLLSHALSAEPEPLKSTQVKSAGVSAYTGDDASKNSVTALAKVRLDLADHRSRRLTYQILDESDLILVMTRSHRDIILSEWPEIKTPIHLFREFANDGQPEVPDPYGGSLDEYIETRDSLATAIPSLVQFIRTLFTNENQHRR